MSFSKWWKSVSEKPGQPHYGCSENWGAANAWEVSRKQTLRALIRRMESDVPGKLWEYGAILEHCKEQVRK